MSFDLNLECNPAIAELAAIKSQDWQAWFAIWIDNLQASDRDYELSLRLTDDQEMQSLNAQYRHQDRPTDVLAFASLEADIPLPPIEMDTEPLYLGDIVISVDTAAMQAQSNHHSLQWELGWLAAHGLLHLLGWDHPDDQSLEDMLAKQTNLMELTSLRQKTTV